MSLYIRNGLNFDIRKLPTSSSECLFIDIMFPNTKPITFGACYRPPSDNNFLANFRPVLDSFETDRETYIMGDFNICTRQKSSLYNSYCDLLQSFSLSQLISEPTRITPQSSSVIDHVLCNPLCNVKSSGVLDVGVSDHQFTFCIRGRIVPPCSEPIVHRFRSMGNYSREMFCVKLREVDWSRVMLETDVSLSLRYFIDILLGVINEIAPYHQIRAKHDSAPWMCRGILVGIRKRDDLFRKFKKDKNNGTLYKAYCKQRNLVQRDIRLAKSEFFRGKMKECGGDSAKLWRQLGYIGYSEPKSKASIVLEHEGAKIFEASKVANVFNRYFTYIASNLVNLLPTPSGIYSTASATFRNFYRNRGIHGPCFTLMPVPRHFILTQLNSFNPGKSTGLDDISPRFLKDGASALAEPIGHIVNLSILTETVPAELKRAKVVPIFKKGSRLDPGNYRPVSILSAVSKILERAVNGQLVSHLNSRKLLYEYQSGFRSKYSTDTCLMNLTDYVKGKVNNGELVGMVMIDLRKAFDTVDGDILIGKLSAMGVTSLDWFRSYLFDREQCTQVGGKNSSFLQITCGVPQGSILGPTLFLCYVNDMASCLNCHLSLYADDSALIFSGKNASQIASFLSQELSLCKKWLIDNRLSLHVGKTESILFGSGRRIRAAGDFKVTCDGETVQRVTSIVYLGVRLDQCLSFDEYVVKVCKNANNRLSFLYRYSHLLDVQTRKMLCNSLVLSNLTYCISAWYPGLGTGLKDRLNVVQRKMVRFVNGWKPREHVGVREIKSAGWLIFPKRASLSQLCHLFKIRAGLAPSYLSRDFCPTGDIHHHHTRGSDLNYFIDSRKFPPNTFHYTTVREWNALPHDLRCAPSLASFKRKLRQYFTS